MNNSTIIFFLALFVLKGSSLISQTSPTDIQKSDSIISEKNNLLLLIKRISLASISYKTDTYKYNEKTDSGNSNLNKRNIGEHHDPKSEIISSFVSFSEDELTLPVDVYKGGNRIVLDDERIKEIPSDSIESVELLLSKSRTAPYGTRGRRGVIIINLKE